MKEWFVVTSPSFQPLLKKLVDSFSEDSFKVLPVVTDAAVRLHFVIRTCRSVTESTSSDTDIFCWMQFSLLKLEGEQ